MKRNGKVGDAAEYDIEQGMDFWLDHLAGHSNYPDICPYCEKEGREENNYEGEQK